MQQRMNLQFIFRGSRNMNRNWNWNYWYRMMSSSSSMMEPWLMLAAPKSDHKLYSLGEKKVISMKKEAPPPPSWAQGERVQHLGCTRGWMASFNEDNQQLFLSNPITCRHIKLPALPLSPGINTSIILTSSSPDAHDCRAFIKYNKRIALCFPGHNSSSTWLPVCNHLHYEDIAYSTRQKRLFCLNFDSLECWDLQSPSFLWNNPLYGDEEEEDEKAFVYTGFAYPLCLVMDEHSNRLFLVKRHLLDGRVGRDGSYMRIVASTGGNDYPHKTLSFDVYEVDVKKGTLTKMEGSLDGLAMFVGPNNSFALPAADFNLTPDSIYFVDYLTGDDCHDIGIFNYVDTKLSSIYYPSHPSQTPRGLAPTFWFTPTPY
ncbi:uncharacterized protein LOC121804322 [Salvia splendens]|uniref:uncharacterized protein LOC121804322 n=1 Tax=Salvia splendens TaxID=180675 RepID=UPI001C25CE9D|nr:uncharacterized protein LOC121804322 [Salvia splendens]